MRTFIAIELPKDIRGSLGKLQEQLKESEADVKWVIPDNIHLTLKFLGETGDERLERIKKAIEEVARENHPYKISIHSLGAFPKINYLRVIWVGTEDGGAETKIIAKTLEEKIMKIGIPKEGRPFSSHITIGRTRSTQNRERLIKKLKNLQESFGKENLEFSVSKITLFKSTLTPKGPIYEVLQRVSLKTA